MEKLTIPLAREQVSSELRRAILTGEIKPGQVLVQEEVSKALGISRMPVREAFQILARDGLIILQKGRRAVVRPITNKDLKDHYTIRALLEGEAAARASSNHERNHLIITQEELQNAVVQVDIASYVNANEKFHRAIWNLSGSERLVTILTNLWNGIPPHLPELLPEQLSRSISEHEFIAQAITDGLADKARQYMIEHIMRSLRDVLDFRKEEYSSDMDDKE